MILTDYHAKYFAYELTKRCPSDSIEKLAGAVAGAQVDLNPHQVDAALFAFNSPLSKGALLADEVGLGKTIEAGLVISQKWAERKRRILVITRRTGLIERWGRGTNRVAEMCREAGVPEPEFSSQGPSAVVMFRANVAGTRLTQEVTPEVTPDVTPDVERLMPWCLEPRSRKELQAKLRLRDEEHFRTAYLLPGISSGLIEMTNPDKPRSRLQKYRLTQAGRALLKQIQGEASDGLTEEPREKR